MILSKIEYFDDEIYFFSTSEANSLVFTTSNQRKSFTTANVVVKTFF